MVLREAVGQHAAPYDARMAYTDRLLVTRIVPARVGLVGNPSDGFGGAVLATVVPPLSATVTAEHADGIVLDGAGESNAWASVDAWLDHVEASGHGDAQRLISAAVWTLAAHLDDHGRSPASGVALRWHTSVPRSVGLAGSSALAVGVIDAVAAAWGVTLDRRVLAALALRAERDVLGIAAGWQDRVVQAFGRTVLVDASRIEAVDGLEVPAVSTPNDPPSMALLIGWREGDAASSDTYHAPLRRAPELLAAPMAELAALARHAAEAWSAGDVDAVGAAMDEGWSIRQACAPLRADHSALVELVRGTGAPATTPGSGGSVVAVAADPVALADAARALAAHGCRSVLLDLADDQR